MKSKTIALACVVSFLLSGCFRHSYSTGAGGDTSRPPQYSSWQAHWLYGLIGDNHVDIKAICPSGNATVKDAHSFLNSVVGALVGIIYFPTTVEVWCDGAVAGSSQPPLEITLAPEELIRIGEDPRLFARLSEERPELADELSAALEQHRSGRQRALAASTP